ncbi:hypothetical protein DCS_07237 [Drechmeria coniospora]|uniref:Uncharacterized protein n=1 Tax=Drechmeria coniospora TaxID=98403 RepID=A0A151GDW4_DRECN|nr:hypothetical protein DCS_07237 [Drechmeria coniospora]KYK55274.1 hypothetical protein DCS_07237 [Drechmeria coniospora]ODA82110.1 hypothetical protein RJ55_00615 [Drechmeria coniospora]
MRPARLVALAGAAAVAVTTSNAPTTAPATTLSVAWTAVEDHVGDDAGSSRSASQPNTSAHFTSTNVSTTRANATASHSHAVEVAGGAIPQQMQASMLGLLGFCIMGLIML